MDCAVHLVRLSSSGGANWPGIPDACINPQMLISERAFSCKGQNVLPKAARRRRLGACGLPQQAAGRRAGPGLVEGTVQWGQASGSPPRGRASARSHTAPLRGGKGDFLLCHLSSGICISRQNLTLANLRTNHRGRRRQYHLRPVLLHRFRPGEGLL